jgi:hypothetical protein
LIGNVIVHLGIPSVEALLGVLLLERAEHDHFTVLQANAAAQVYEASRNDCAFLQGILPLLITTLPVIA